MDTLDCLLTLTVCPSNSEVGASPQASEQGQDCDFFFFFFFFLSMGFISKSTLRVVLTVPSTLHRLSTGVLITLREQVIHYTRERVDKQREREKAKNRESAYK
jgi:hypothetical protein